MSRTAGGTTTRYTQDLAAPLTQVLNDGSADYLYGLARLAAQTGVSRTWYTTDALGSVRQTLSDSGAVLTAAQYDPWGNLEAGSAAPFGFTGELSDGGLTYLRARWYHPTSGVFLAKDSFSGYAGRPYSMHPYQYASSNPALWADPTGNDQWWQEDAAVSCAGFLVWNAEQGRCTPEQERFLNRLAAGWTHSPPTSTAPCGCSDLGDRNIFTIGDWEPAPESIPVTSPLPGMVITSGPIWEQPPEGIPVQPPESGILITDPPPNEPHVYVTSDGKIKICYTAGGGSGGGGITTSLPASSGNSQGQLQIAALIARLISSRTPADLDAAVRNVGVPFVESQSAWGEPLYQFTGYDKLVEVRIHMNSDGSIRNFRIGVQLYTPQQPTYPLQDGTPWMPNAVDEPMVRRIDQQLVQAHGVPQQDRSPNPGGWDGEYVDPLGYAYLGADGTYVGLRSDAGHIKPR